MGTAALDGAASAVMVAKDRTHAESLRTRRAVSRTAALWKPKRAKLPAMQRNASVVLGNVGTADDVDVLTRALDDPEPRVRD